MTEEDRWREDYNNETRRSKVQMKPDINMARAALVDAGHPDLVRCLEESDEEYGILIISGETEHSYAIVKAVAMAHQAVGHKTSNVTEVKGLTGGAHAHFGCLSCGFLTCETCKRDLFE